MTEIVVDADTSLAGAIKASSVGLQDLFLVLRDADGKVFWSGDLVAWRFDFGTDKVHVRTAPVSERADKAAEAARLKTTFELQKAGLL